VGVSPSIPREGDREVTKRSFTTPVVLVSILAAHIIYVSAQNLTSSFPYSVELNVGQAQPGLYELIVPMELMDKARDDLADLRIHDANGREIPYAVRIGVSDKGESTTWSIPVQQPELLRHQGASASTWNIDLGGRVPCDAIVLDVSDASFSRPFQVEAIDGQRVRLVAAGELTKRADPETSVVIHFNYEEHVRKLRLTITDYSNRALSIVSIKASAATRQLLFELKQPIAQPLRMFFGNAKTTSPHYDLEKTLPAKLPTKPIRITAGPTTPNPDYKPEPLPFTERAPWLIYLVLSVATIALALILFSLARRTLRQTKPPS